MPGFGASLVVSAHPDRVWEFVGDLLRHPEWAADALEITQIDEWSYSCRANARGRIFNARIDVLVKAPERRIEFRVTDESGVYRHRIDLARQGNGTLVTRHVHAEQLSPSQRIRALIALFPIRRPALQHSLERLAEVAPD